MNFKHFLFFLFSLSVLLSCKEKSRHANIIAESIFIDVLTDIHLADATLVVKGYRIKNDSTQVRLFYNDVLMEYNVTQKQIQNTFEYYTNNPKKFEKVYEKVSENIVKREEKFQESITQEELKDETHNKDFSKNIKKELKQGS